MPLSPARQEVAIRFGVAQSLLTELKLLEPAPGQPVPASVNVQKAMFLVALYAAWEFAITRTVTDSANIITQKQVRCCDLATAMFPLAMDPEIKSISTPGGRDKKWIRRSALFSRAANGSPATIYESALTSELGNVWAKALRQVYEAFGLPDSPFYEANVDKRIDELVEKRNSIAHGRIAPADVGRDYTSGMLESLLLKIESQKNATISHFETFIAAKAYVLPGAQANYP